MFIDKSHFKLGMSGEAINNLHQRLVLLGFEIPVEELQDDHYGAGTEAAVRQFQAANGLSRVDGRVDEATARGLGIGDFPASVAGIVCRPDGEPLADIAVQLYQHSAGGEKVLGDVLTGRDGKFSLPWPAGIRGGIRVRAGGGAGKEISWKAALATDTVWVRLSVGGEYRGPTRFSVLTQTLAPLSEARAFHAIGGAGQAAEIKAIGDAARVPGADLSRFVLAHKLAARTEVQPEVFFALLTNSIAPETMASLATNGDAEALDDAHVDQVLDEALRPRADELRGHLAAAVADNLVPELDVEAAAAQLHALRVEHVAAKPITWSAPELSDDEHPCCATIPHAASERDGGDPGAAAMHATRPLHVHDAALRDVVATALRDPVAQRRVVEAFAVQGSHAKLATVVDSATGLSPEQRDHVRFTLEAAVLLGNHLPLVARVQELRANKAIERVCDLARFDEADWAKLLRDSDPDAHIALPGRAALAAAPAGDRIDQLAHLLARRLESRYPTAALAGRLDKDKAALRLDHSHGIQQFLDGAPAFCVRHTHIDRFVNDTRSDTLAAGGDSAEVISDLKKLQRAYKLTARFDLAKAMLDAGHHSAYSIHAAGPEQFAAQMTAAGASEADAQAMYAQAEQMHATTVTLMANLNSEFTGVAPAAVARAIDQEDLAVTLASFPTVQSLFGSADYCACADCRAIHGPAAYFVDILEFLKARRTPDNAKSARDVVIGRSTDVIGRRSDLKFIEISCANTNGVVPYVDLVCEVLEDAVGSAPADADVKARQTSGTTEELRANPQFVRDSAYTTLATATFPITAPFDLFGCEVRAYFDQLGVPRHELMTALRSSSSPTDAQIAAERFGFSSAALNVVTTASPSNPWTLWKLQPTGNNIPDPRKPDDPNANRTGTNLVIMSFVPILLDRAKLTHRELIQLLETRFVNPNKALSIVLTGTQVGTVTDLVTCDSGKQTVNGWTDPLLTGFNRFIRLWRQLGCAIWDLDKVLAASKIANGVLDTAAIAQLARVDTIARRLKLPWDELLVLWGPIDSVNYLNVLDPAEPTVPSVYRRKFRNATVTASTTVFADDPASLTGDLDNVDVLAGIAAALDLSASDIKRIRAAGNLGAQGTALNATNLSVIVRYATLAKGLGLSISDLLTAIAVTGVNPIPTDVNALTPTLTLQFLAALDQVRSSGFSLVELNYLLRHDSAIDSNLGLSDATITTWLDELRKELVRLGAALTSPAAADLVVQRISAMLPLDPTLTQQVLTATLPGGGQTIAQLFTANTLIARDGGAFTTATTRANYSAIYDAYTAIDKMRIVLERWKVNPADALWLLQRAASAGWMQLHTLPGHLGATTPATLAALDTLRQNVVVQQTLASPTGVRLFDFVLNPGLPPGSTTGSPTLATAVANVAQLGGWTDADINALAGRFGLTTAASLVANATVAVLRDAMAWPRKLGTDVATALLYAGFTVGAPEARKARQLAKSWFSNDQWLGVSAAIQDRLREQKRAALVAYLLGNPQSSRGQKWVTVEDLYGFFLIDPEMSPVADTTRIKQAAASLQLFVQRCFLQLEEFNVDSDSVWKQWDWMKRFRLWEANRKIFLYPENWYDPAQRRDMSPYFDVLVNDLQQSDLTNTVAEDALRSYLHKLVDVAHLEVSGMWEEPQGSQSILHVVARTRKAPYIYSYRRREATGAWSAWEPLDAAFNANHVMPVIWNKRLFMLWTDFIEKALPGDIDDRRVPVPPTDPTSTTAREPRRYWEITLSWLERRDNLWLPKKQAQRKQLLNNIISGQAVLKRGVAFRVTTPLRTNSILSNLVVSLYVPSGAQSQALGQWILTSSQDDPLVLNTDRTTLGAVEDMKYVASLPAGTLQIGARPKLAGVEMGYHFNAFGGDNPGVSGILGLQRPITGTPLVTILNSLTMGRVISVRYGDSDQFKFPFFISDSQRTFYGRFNISTNAWKLETFYHPFVELFVQQLNQSGIAGLYDRTLQVNPESLRGTTNFSFSSTYQPNTDTAILAQPYPAETVDYTQSGPYAIYNWELFLHVPLLIAKRLADNQHFEEALRWFHYIFNPNTVNVPSTANPPDPPAPGTVPQRYWNPKVFRDLLDADYNAQRIEQLLALINQHDSNLEQRVADWRANPFDPNLVAQARPVAYQKAVVMAYISTLIAWGDQLFRGDTIESINEATQLYLLASQLLGPRPQSLRALQPKLNSNYADLSANLDTFSNAMVTTENIVSVPPPATGGTAPTPTLLHTFYFCIPPNDQMLSYWDKVSDRLFKIRHGMNIDGVARPLALYEPPIDPGLLSRAAAAGIDIAAALADASVDVGCYRFHTLWQTAHDLCQDVRALGNAILSANERQDAEEMSRLRATQEVALTSAVREVKARQLDEANDNKQALQATRAMAELKKKYYESREFMNKAERHAEKLNQDAVDEEGGAAIYDRLTVISSVIPNVSVGIAGFGGSPSLSASFGGDTLSRFASAEAGVHRGTASIKSRKAMKSTSLAGYQRRQEDWDHQLELAKKELEQLDKQLLAAEIRIAIAAKELENQDLQIAQAEANAALLQSKFTNKALYNWMLSQLSATYFHAYQLAYDLAKRASKAYSFELGVPEPGFIQFGYWDSLHKGLVAGDKLHFDLRRLQAEHLNKNKRELELTKHVSLLQLDPHALVRLRETGSCDVVLPEKLFDQDQPGHYYRRLKTVSVTLPCVTGPYSSVNGTLSLTSHSIRTSNSLAGGYRSTSFDNKGLPNESGPPETARFAYVSAAGQSVALSSGREDAGMFEVSLRDERYLPFEAAGAVSAWHLELQQQDNRFDLATLSDVVLHVRYTARDGGEAMRNAARDEASKIPPPRDGVQLLSARTEFPDAHARLFAPTGSGQRLDIVLGPQHFPFIPAGQKITLTGLSAILTFTNDRDYASYDAVAPSARLPARVGLTPGDGSVPTTSKSFVPETTRLNKVPATDTLALSSPIGPVTIAFVESEIADKTTLLVQTETQPDSTVLHRLIRDKIDDILLLVSYKVELRT